MSLKFPVKVCLFFCLFFAATASADQFDPNGNPAVDFLYINANAGEAAGGHTAVRMGSSVFHYQFFPDDTFLLVREPWDSFRVLYSDLHNRSMAIATLALPSSELLKIRNHFVESLAGQQQFFDELSRARQSRKRLEDFQAGKRKIQVNCFGFFDATSGDGDALHLKAIIARTLGDTFLINALKEAQGAAQESLKQINEDESFDERQLLDSLALQAALSVLLDARGLAPSGLIAAMPWENALNPEEQEQLLETATYLQQSILALLQSRRPDRGETLLLQTARYLALRKSLAESRLVTLDPFFEGIRTVELEEKDIDDRKLSLLLASLQGQAVRRQSLFLKEKKHIEIASSLLENSRARAWELFRVSKTQRLVRILVGTVLPSKPGVVPLAGVRLDKKILRSQIDQLEKKITLLENESREKYAYNLLSRNCATELIRTLNESFPNAAMAENTLGGYLDPDGGLTFIPFLFYNQVTDVFPITEEHLLSARRLRDLKKLYQQEDMLQVWLRESNTLSSTLYEPRDKDTPFLFFTDDSLLLRPLLGVANIGYAALYGVAGLFLFPFDGMEPINQAGRGIFYSLPELLFGNIRKGSYPLASAVVSP